MEKKHTTKQQIEHIILMFCLALALLIIAFVAYFAYFWFAKATGEGWSRFWNTLNGAKEIGIFASIVAGGVFIIFIIILTSFNVIHGKKHHRK